MDRKPFPDLLQPTPEEKAEAEFDATEAAEAAAELEELREGRRWMTRIGRLGMALTETVAEYALGDACPPPDPEDPPVPRIDAEVAARWLQGADVPLAFARVTRAVRIATVARAELAKERRTLSRSMRPGAGGPVSQTTLEKQKRVAKQVRIMTAEQIMNVAAPADHETLRLEIDAWLENPSVISALGEVPIGKIVASLVECMGYRPSLRKFTDAELGVNIPWVKPERPLGAPPLPRDQLPVSKHFWTPPKAAVDVAADDEDYDEDDDDEDDEFHDDVEALGRDPPD